MSLSMRLFLILADGVDSSIDSDSATPLSEHLAACDTKPMYLWSNKHSASWWNAFDNWYLSDNSSY